VGVSGEVELDVGEVAADVQVGGEDIGSGCTAVCGLIDLPPEQSSRREVELAKGAS